MQSCFNSYTVGINNIVPFRANFTISFHHWEVCSWPTLSLCQVYTYRTVHIEMHIYTGVSMHGQLKDRNRHGNLYPFRPFQADKYVAAECS
jgi:hypothetical protein